MHTKQCTQCSKTFKITDQDLAFYQRVSPIIAGKRYDVPPPTHCPDCRLQRRLAVRNERALHQVTCQLCHQTIISQYAQDSGFTVYCPSCWWSDKWDPMQYARSFDFTRPFFEQFSELLHAVPAVSLMNSQTSLDNSVYVNYTADAKDCYLCFATNWIENCLYSSYIWESKDSMDCSYSTKLELCYFCMDCDNLYDCRYLLQSQNCHDCIIGYGLQGCSNCFGCINLVNKQYYWFNEPLSEAEYQAKLHNVMSDEQQFANMQQLFKDFSLKFPHKYSYQIHCESSSGDGIKNCKNCQHCFDGYGGEDLKWLMNFPGSTKDCYDIAGCAQVELCYEAQAIFPGYRVLFSNSNLTGGKDVLYSAFCEGGENIFGCVGTKKAQYSILNTAYSRVDYEKLIERIITHMRQTGEWGEFFPITISPFAYNETMAVSYYPTTRDKVKANGWRWWEDPQRVITAALTCSTCGKSYQIIAQEKKFYEQHHIFPPKQCHECRHQTRIASRNSRALWQRQCMCTQVDHSHAGRCAIEFETTYSPDRKELIYCETCYQKEIY